MAYAAFNAFILNVIILDLDKLHGKVYCVVLGVD